jgi:hypothetical protein
MMTTKQYLWACTVCIVVLLEGKSNLAIWLKDLLLWTCQN